ncbi:MAG: glutamine--fructose-6-phosphate transaminase (isomerizing) [Treponema sp.]|jgi:glucosamine--fructose-6-phosphate aminotransferase (isomerizing)|nr:glutamine--fructose-6-phosphate transaminase (isomerizing) [Treponema sp.]
MCGITGYIGGRQAAPVLLGALEKLEYRGYDSAGVAILEEPGGRLFVRKAEGRLQALAGLLARETPRGALGIGHTRWATHGEPSDDNAHPHTDLSGKIAVVHNGIIENYAPLKEWLQARNVVFKSDTDTEVIVHLVDYYHREDAGRSGIFGAVKKALRRLEGSYALAVISSDFPDRIIAARKDSPLIIGLGQGENLLASDAPALLAHTKTVLYLEERELAALYRDHADVFNEDGERIIRRPETIEWDNESAEKGGFAHFMLKEINEQPRALGNTLRPRLKQAADGALDIHFDELAGAALAEAKRIVITACGTAYHAGLLGKFLFEGLARIPVEVDIASEYRYRNPLSAPGDLFIVISQSGETADTLAAMRLAKKAGGRVIALTNVIGSTLAREADFTVNTLAGPELAVASTKAFTSQLMCLCLLALSLGRDRGRIKGGEFQRLVRALQRIPDQAGDILAKQETVQKFAARHFNKNKVFFMGRQADYCVSMESALKLKEISYTHSEAFAAGELKHGPIALVDPGTLVAAFATQDALFDKIVSNIREATARGAKALVITWEGERAFNAAADEVFFIPKTETPFSPLLSIIPAQLFAYYCAVQKGNDPDKPRNLAKSVTVE